MTRCFLRAPLVLLAVSAGPASAFGPDGHMFVGAIADHRVAGRPVALKIFTLLDGLTLEEAAVLPDKIKAWDKVPPDKPHAYHVTGHPVIEADLVKFWKAHNKKDQPDYHRNFHFTDVPVGSNSKYGDGTIGRKDFDLVHMITACVKVLQANTEDTQLAITPRVAVILLAHYVGDLHQPLHVGAQYFNSDKKISNPDTGGEALSDVGGNNITLVVSEESERGALNQSYVLHTYWDDNTVETMFDLVKAEIAGSTSAPHGAITRDMAKKFLGSKEPAGWKLAADVPLDKYAERYADDVLPFSNQAHSRLEFSGIAVNGQKVNGFAHEKQPQPDGVAYGDWAGGVVRVTIHKGGWRLADLLEKAIP